MGNKIIRFMLLIIIFMFLGSCQNELLDKPSYDQTTISRTKAATSTPYQNQTKTPTTSPTLGIDSLKGWYLAIQTDIDIRLYDLINYQMILTMESPLYDPYGRGKIFWSPDGKYFAYEDYRDEVVGTYLMNTTTGKEVLLRDYPGEEGNDQFPFSTGDWISWSPDGKSISFVSITEGVSDIFVYNLINESIINITNSPSMDYSTGWSPDGKRIIFLSDRSGSSQIYSMSPDGKNVIQLTYSEIPNIVNPVWSPDSSKIAFKIISDPPSWLGTTEPVLLDLFIMDFDGSNLIKLFSGDKYPCNWCEEIVWSHDSSKIAFSAYSEENRNISIYTIDINSKEITRLSQNLSYNEMIWSWHPYEKKILYQSIFFSKENGFDRLCESESDYHLICKVIMNPKFEYKILQVNIIYRQE